LIYLGEKQSENEQFNCLHISQQVQMPRAAQCKKK